jgi:CheY-like chemotaxis protein
MRTVLYVDDDHDDRTLMIAAVARATPQFALKLQSTYYGTIDYLQNQSPFQDSGENPEPDLVLLDCSLGNFKGTDLIVWIRTKSNLKAMPIVMFSARTEDQVVRKCYAIGADYFIPKPRQGAQWVKIVKGIDACLRSPHPRLEKLAALAVRPDLSQQSLRRLLRANRARHQDAVKKRKELRMGIDLLLAEAKELRRKFPFKPKDR